MRQFIMIHYNVIKIRFSNPVRDKRPLEKYPLIYFRAVGAEPMLRTYGTLIT